MVAHPTVSPTRQQGEGDKQGVGMGVGPARSWLSLLASSSLGVHQATTTTTEVRLESPQQLRGPLRLVVQAFDHGPRASRARPVSSLQRNVTLEELRRGVRVSLVDLAPTRSSKARVIAWVEPGHADLEFDGRTARPGQRSLVGTADSEGGSASIVLQGRAA